MAFVLGAVMVLIAAAIGVGLLFVPPSMTSLAIQVIYGVVIIAGALSLMILGMLGKIVPFLVWMAAYGPKVGRERVPVATALSSRELERSWIVAHIAGVVFAVAAVWIGSGVVAQAAAWMLTIGGALYLWNFGRITRHLVARWRPAYVTQS
jgi:hypothetical protein